MIRIVFKKRNYLVAKLIGEGLDEKKEKRTCKSIERFGGMDFKNSRIASSPPICLVSQEICNILGKKRRYRYWQILQAWHFRKTLDHEAHIINTKHCICVTSLFDK